MKFIGFSSIFSCLLLSICCRGLVLAIDASSARMSAMISNLSKNGYDPRVRPSANVTNVAIQLVLVSFGPIIQKTMSVEADIVLRQWWNDPRLAFDNSSIFTFYGDPSDDIWLPDTHISNARKLHAYHGLTKNIRCSIGPNGNVFVSARLTVEFSCDVDYRLYPFDTQICSMDLESYAYNSDEMKISWKFATKPIEFIEGGVHLIGYKVTKIDGVETTFHYLDTKPFSLLQAKFSVHRLFPYYLNHMYIPGIFLVALSWCTFWMPPAAVPARVSLIVTNFLSSVFVMHNAVSILPKVPYATSLELFGLVNIFSIIAVMIEYIFVLRLPALKRKRAKSNNLKRIMVRSCITPENKSMENEKNNDMDAVQNHIDEQNQAEASNVVEYEEICDHIIDMWARVVAPALYMLFIVVYFSIYRKYI